MLDGVLICEEGRHEVDREKGATSKRCKTTCQLESYIRSYCYIIYSLRISFWSPGWTSYTCNAFMIFFGLHHMLLVSLGCLFPDYCVLRVEVTISLKKEHRPRRKDICTVAHQIYTAQILLTYRLRVITHIGLPNRQQKRLARKSRQTSLPRERVSSPLTSFF